MFSAISKHRKARPCPVMSSTLETLLVLPSILQSPLVVEWTRLVARIASCASWHSRLLWFNAWWMIARNLVDWWSSRLVFRVAIHFSIMLKNKMLRCMGLWSTMISRCRHGFGKGVVFKWVDIPVKPLHLERFAMLCMTQSKFKAAYTSIWDTLHAMKFTISSVLLSTTIDDRNVSIHR